MNMLNSIIVEGNLTEDVTRPIAGAVRFEIAVERKYGTQTEVSNFPVIAYGNMADFLAGDEGHTKHGMKGQGVRVVGRLKQDRWTDEDGKHWSAIVIIAGHIEFKPFFKKETA